MGFYCYGLPGFENRERKRKKEKDNRIVTISTWPTGGLTGCTVEGVARQVVRYLGVEGDKEELEKEKKNEKL